MDKNGNWSCISRNDLIDLYVTQEYTDQEIAKYFNVSKSQVAYKRRKFGLSAAELRFKKFLGSQDDDLVKGLQESMKRNVIDMNTEDIARSLTHYLFRNGPIEDMHANSQLSQNDMMILNKFIYNRLTTIIYLLKENDWVRLILILESQKQYGSDWDKPELCIDEIDKIFALEMEILSLN